MKKYIGLDLGTNTLGIAISDSLGIVHGKENYRFEKGNYRAARQYLINLIKELDVKDIVIGYPIQLDGHEGKRCESVKRFINDLKKEIDNINVYYQNEMFTTIEARERLQSLGLKEDKIKEVIDMQSAIVILETFLNKYGEKGKQRD